MATRQANAKLALRITTGVIGLVLNTLFYIVVIVGILTFTKSAYNFTYQVFGDVVVDEEQGREVKVRIISGDSTMQVAAKLEQNKIIVNKTSFYLKAKIQKVNIMPGTYVVSSSMTYDEIFNELSDVNNSLTTEEYQEEQEEPESKTNSSDTNSDGE